MIRLGLVRVRGRSMEPALHEGDRVVVLRGMAPRIGRMAIVRLPPAEDGTPRPLAVKRIVGHDPDDPSRYWVERDNPRAGVDSWQVGSLGRDQIRAVVLGRVPQRLRAPGAARSRPR